MDYSGYSIEQIFDSCRDFDKLCATFFELAPNEEVREKLKCVLYEGQYNGFYFCSGNTNKNNPNIEGLRRISMADLLLRNPDTFDSIVANKVCLFHGTNGNALPSILKHGLTSGKESNRRGIDVKTGEEWSKSGHGRRFISFADVLDYAEYYSSFSHKGGTEALSFPVVIGTTVDDMYKAGKYNVPSEISEVGVENCLPLENIKMIGVPSDKVDFVQRLVGDDSHIRVLPVDGIGKKFYYVDVCDDNLEIIQSRLNNARSEVYSKKETKKFTSGDAVGTLSNFKLSKVREKLWEVKPMGLKPYEMESLHDVFMRGDPKLAKVREHMWNDDLINTKSSEMNAMFEDNQVNNGGEPYGRKNYQ